MRVAVVATSFARGGAEEYLYKLYRALRRDHGVEVVLIGSLPDWPPELGEVHPIRFAQKLTRRKGLVRQIAGSVLSAVQTLWRLAVIRPDVVHVQYFEPKLLIVGLVSRWIPVLWTEHGPLPPTLPPVGRALLRYNARRSAVVAVSEGVRGSLDDAGIRAEVIPNPLPASFASAAARRPRSRKRILYAGRLHENKRVHLLVAAAALLPDVQVVVAGDGPERAVLESRAPSNVTFLGSVSDVREQIAASDAVVVCSGRAAREGSPMVALEARMSGCRLLMAADCHAADEAVLLGGTTFDPHPQSLAAAIEQVEVDVVDELPAGVIEERSEASWVRQHHRVLARSRTTGA